MSTTPNLTLPYILAAQSQKHVTHNEALRELDAIVQLSVLDRHISAPPGAPAEGARYIVGPSPTGAWAGQAGRIGAWQDGAWAFYIPREGWLAWIADEDIIVAWSGTAWIGVGGSGDASFTSVGINATADSTNRLALSSPATLLNHAGAGHQVKINKNAATDTASLLYQTGFSGRAEIGTAGSDKLAIKISPDGAAWTEMLVFDPDGDVLLKGHNARIQLGAFFGPSLSVHGTGASSSCIGAARWSNNNGGCTSLFAKSRGAAPGAHTALASGDFMLNQAIHGSDGTEFIESVRVAAVVDGTPATGSMPGRLVFSTMPAGSALAERMRITSAGNVGIGTTAPSTSLHVNGPIRCASYTVATVPSASGVGAGAQIYVSNESGGAVTAFSDGTNWRRVTDRAVIS